MLKRQRQQLRRELKDARVTHNVITNNYTRDPAAEEEGTEGIFLEMQSRDCEHVRGRHGAVRVGKSCRRPFGMCGTNVPDGGTPLVEDPRQPSPPSRDPDTHLGDETRAIGLCGSCGGTAVHFYPKCTRMRDGGNLAVQAFALAGCPQCIAKLKRNFPGVRVMTALESAAQFPEDIQIIADNHLWGSASRGNFVA